MISGRYANSFCCEDISLIENYEAAINDETQTWHCHHRLESDLGLSRDELKNHDLYYNRPASELIFLTPDEHVRLHMKGKKSHRYRKRASEETKQKIRENHYDCSREKNGMYGKHPTWMNNGISRVRAMTQEDIEHYLELGYDFGKKLK